MRSVGRLCNIALPAARLSGKFGLVTIVRGDVILSLGIQVGDVIMKIDGQPIEQFEDLRLHIAQHKAGESLEVQVRRDLEVIKLTVVLGSAKNNLEN